MSEKRAVLYKGQIINLLTSLYNISICDFLIEIGFSIFFNTHIDKCIAGEAKLVRDDLQPDLEDSVFYTVNDQLLSGRIEYCYNGSDYSTVCSDHWDNNEASVLCKQLGFSPYGKHASDHSLLFASE